MMKLLFTILIFCFSQQVFSQTLKPGVWKAKVAFKVNGITLPSKEDEDCILPHEVKDVKTSIVKNLKRYGCVLDKWIVKGEKLDAALTCKSDDLDATGSLSGTVNQTHYKLSGEAKGTYQQMLPATAIIDLQGDWQKACDK
jgi:hypothetical protein